MKKILTIITIFLSLSFANAHATTASEQLAGLLNNLENMQGTFNQTIMASSDSAQQSAGKFALQRPGKFRWQIDKPSSQLLVADGSQIWFYDVDLQQVTQQAQTHLSTNTPAALLSGDTASILQAFDVHLLNKPNKTGIWYVLTPRTKENLFRSVQLNFIDNVLQGMIIKDNLGQSTNIVFSQVQVNTNLANNLFQFKPPVGVDVIKQG